MNTGLPSGAHGAAIAAITERVLRTEYPTALHAAADGSGCAVTVRSPGRDATRLYERGGTLVHTVPGAGPLRWHGGGFVGRSYGGLRRWRLGVSESEELGRWDGRRVSAACSDDLWLAGAETVWRHDASGAEALAVGLGAPLLGDVALSPRGLLLAVRTIEEGGSSSSLRLVSRAGDELHRWHEPTWCVLAPAFVGEEQVVVTRMRRDSTVREVVLLDLGSLEHTTLVREESSKGFVPLPPAVAGNAAAYVRYVDGWPLLCVLDLASGQERVVNPGPHEDLTDVHDAPVFSPDGRFLAFNSSAAGLHQRHLHVYDLVDGSLGRRSFAVGATGAKAWLGNDRLAFVESDEQEGASLRWLDLGGPPSSEPPVRTSGRPVPQHVTLRGAEHSVPADLYVPTDLVPDRRHPALVYAHGGVFRQLTRGYPASYAYSLLHEINLGLLQLGFVVMSVEYRGSMGFGLAHDQANHLACGIADTDDCALAASHLAGLPYVDPDRIGIWGLSWGGTMTLQALVRYPERFAAGVNLAGIWDFEQRARFWNQRQAGQPIYFDGRMGPAGSDERRRASARELAHQLRGPLLSLHGTDDEAVDYGQQLQLAEDARQSGKDVRTVTLAGERHVFGAAESWREAVPAIVGFLLEELAPRVDGT